MFYAYVSFLLMISLLHSFVFSSHVIFAPPGNIVDLNITSENCSSIDAHVKVREHLVPIQNRYGFSNVCNLRECGDFHITAHYVDKQTCNIHVRRLDNTQWREIELSVYIQSVHEEEKSQSVREVFYLGNSISYMKVFTLNTSVALYPDPEANRSQFIPKAIIQTFASREVQGLYHWNAYQTFVELNPEYELFMFTDKECRQFIQSFLPQRVLDAYDILISPTFKADLFRYAYLALQGGCYFDHKMIARIPMRNVIRPQDSLLVCADASSDTGQPPESLRNTERLYNAVICSAKGEPRLWRTIDRLVTNIEKRHSEGSDLSLTGPVAFFRAIRNDITNDNLRFKHGVRWKLPAKRKYEDFYVKERLTNQILLTKFYKGYAADPRNRYGTMWNSKTIFFETLVQFKHWKVFVYPGQTKCIKMDYTATGSLELKPLTSNSFYELPASLQKQERTAISPSICYHVKLVAINDNTSEEFHVEIPSHKVPSAGRFAFRLP